MSVFVPRKLSGRRSSGAGSIAGYDRTVTMTMRELDRFKVTPNVADGKLKPWRAKPGNNRLDAVTANRARSIIRDRHADFGPTRA